MAKIKEKELIAEIKSELEGNTLGYAKRFIKERFGKIDSDIEIGTIRSDRWSYRPPYHLVGIQLSTGYYRHKTIKRVMIKGEQISLTKLQNAISELTQIAKSKRQVHAETEKYRANLEQAGQAFYTQLRSMGFKQDYNEYRKEYWGNFEFGDIEIELKYTRLDNKQFHAYPEILIHKELTGSQVLKVAEYLKGINDIIK